MVRLWKCDVCEDIQVGVHDLSGLSCECGNGRLWEVELRFGTVVACDGGRDGRFGSISGLFRLSDT